MQERRKFCGLNITHSVQDRVFLGVMGLLFMLPAGYVLYRHHSVTWPRDMSLGARLFLVFSDEVVLTIFLLALCSFIWCVAAPRWIERLFEKTISKFVLMLALISLLLLGVMIYVFSVGKQRFMTWSNQCAPAARRPRLQPDASGYYMSARCSRSAFSAAVTDR